MKTSASLVSVGLFLLLVGPVHAASPLMGTAPGSTPSCGVPGNEVCIPSVDVFTNFPPAAPSVLLGPGSPPLGVLGAGRADILIGGPFAFAGPPAVFVPAAALGLVPGDVIDALAFSAAGPPAVISLAPGSPSLPGIPAGPQDLLVV